MGPGRALTSRTSCGKAPMRAPAADGGVRGGPTALDPLPPVCAVCAWCSVIAQLRLSMWRLLSAGTECCRAQAGAGGAAQRHGRLDRQRQARRRGRRQKAEEPAWAPLRPAGTLGLRTALSMASGSPAASTTAAAAWAPPSRGARPRPWDTTTAAVAAAAAAQRAPLQRVANLWDARSRHGRICRPNGSPSRSPTGRGLRTNLPGSPLQVSTCHGGASSCRAGAAGSARPGHRAAVFLLVSKMWTSHFRTSQSSLARIDSHFEVYNLRLDMHSFQLNSASTQQKRLRQSASRRHGVRRPCVFVLTHTIASAASGTAYKFVR